MFFRGRSVLILAAIVFLNLGIRGTNGFYSHVAFALAMLALMLALATCFIPGRWTAGKSATGEGDAFLLACATLLLNAVNVGSTDLSYANRGWPEIRLIIWSVAGLLVTVIALASRPGVLFGEIDRNDLKRHGVIFAAALVTAIFLPIAVNRLSLTGSCSSLHEFIASNIDYEWTHLDSLTLAACILLWLLGCLLFLRRRTVFTRYFDRGGLRLLVLFCSVSLLLGLALRGSVLLASPNPVIDVFTLLCEEPDQILAGRNPYTHDIVSPYGTARAEALGVADPPDPRPAGYPPHPYLLALPFRALGADPRWANVVGDGLAALALLGVALQRRRPLAGFLALALWLFIPRTTFMIEQAWYEPMIGGLLGVGLLLTEAAGWQRWTGYLLIGLGLTAKQYGAPMLPALLWPHRKHWRPIIVGLVAGLAVMLPWLIWSPHDFLDTVFWKHLDRPSQHEGAITIAAGCNNIFGFVPWCGVMWALAGVLVLLISARAPRHGAATALALGTSLFVFCLFHTQGFFNYFYLVQYLWLLGFVGLFPPAQSAKSELPATPQDPA
jgi:hypothetical protein